MSDRLPTATWGFAIRMQLARAALLWERVWPASWPAVLILGVFVVLALFGLFPALPPLLHAALLLGFGAAFIIALGALRAVGLPDRAAARRRIERTSGLAHRPLQALTDRPSRPLDAPAARLWDTHLRRMAAAAGRLRVGFPAAGLAARDPWGLRALLAILLLLGVIDAGGAWRYRLQRAVTPRLASAAPAVAPSLDIWMTPPQYTGLPPRFLRSGIPLPVPAPVGSTLLAQVHGGSAAPDLAIDGASRAFKTIDKDNFEAAARLVRGRLLTVTQEGATLGRWPIAIIPDQPPKVAFAQPPAATPHAALRLDYRASDDYGVETVTAVIRRLGGKTPGDKAGGKPAEVLKIGLPLPGLHRRKARATAYEDLTAHPWAGLPVELRLVATDALGQPGESAPVHMILPERVFHNPVARAIVAERKELVRDPASRLAVAEILGDLRRERRLYGNDTLAFLGLRVAQEELRHQQEPQTLAEVERLMWETALRIEDGGLALTENQLRRLERQLQDALARNAPNAEIQRLMNQLQQALDRYLQQLARNLARHPEAAAPPPENAQTMTARELERMLDRARQLARSGARDEARQLLAQLQNMLENLRTAAAPPQGAREAEQIMRAMRTMMQQQKNLLDRSFRAAQQSIPGMMPQPGDNGQPGGAMNGDARAQEALRQALGAMMRRLGGAMGRVPDPLGRAERAMRGAVGALQQGLPGEAVTPQTDALDQLQQAARQLARQMQSRLGGQPGYPQAIPGTPMDRAQGRDPFGRPLNNYGSYDEGDVKIPDKGTIDRAREILDELRRRAGQPARPRIEHDYIERLLEQF